MRWLAIPILLFASVAGATTRYVSPSGSDSNACTLQAPCATPDHAVNAVAAAGDTVQVAAGTYNYGTSFVNFTNGGTSGNPILVTCATRGACKLTNTANGSPTPIVVVEIQGNWLTLDGFEIFNQGVGGTGVNLGIYVTASGISLTRNIVHDIPTDCTNQGGGGIQIAVANLSPITIDSNLIYNIAYTPAGGARCSSSVVQFDGILSEQTGFSTTTTITNNIIYGTSGGWGIGCSTNCIATNNLIFNTTNGGIFTNNQPAGAVIENNMIFSTGQPTSGGGSYSGRCAIQAGTTAGLPTYGFNDLFGNSGGNYGTGFSCQNSGLKTGDIAVDPSLGTTFINWQLNGSGNYHEKSGSPTIGKGTTTSTAHDYDGNTRIAPFDMGPYQFQAGSTNHTWYVTSGGGTIYNATTNTTGQCDGLHDAVYPGSGVNQPCAAGNLYNLWANNTASSPSWAESGFIGGDTVIVDNNFAFPGAIGAGPLNSSGGGLSECGGVNQNCYMPDPPAGTATQHTRFLGANFASCSKPDPNHVGFTIPDTTKTTLLYGRFGVKWLFSFGSATSKYIDVQCFSISDNANCIHNGAAPSNKCSTSPPYDDYMDEAFHFDPTAGPIFVTDVYMHGLAFQDIFGPPSNGSSFTRVKANGGPLSCFEFDLGTTPATPGVGSFTGSNVDMEGCGFFEDHATGLLEWGLDDNNGGYGDAWGLPDTSSPAYTITCDHCIAANSTQDGFDARHVEFPSTVTFTNTLSYNNMGNQIKFGAPGANGISLANSYVNGNCYALASTTPPAGFAAGYNTFGTPTGLSDFCRANGASVLSLVNDNWGTTGIINNTITSSYGQSGSGGIAIEFDCWTTCTTATQVKLDNNMFLLYPNTTANGSPSNTGNMATQVYLAGIPATVFTNTGSSYTNNANYAPQGGNINCPNGGFSEANAVCVNPNLNTTIWPVAGFIEPRPNAASPLIGAGVFHSAITNDFFGTSRLNPPTIGASEPISSSAVQFRGLTTLYKGKVF